MDLFNKKKITIGCNWLNENDKTMAKIIERVGILKPLKKPDNYFVALVSSVVSQQLSVKAAATIFGRLTDASGGELQPEILADMPEDIFRSAGISKQKFGYISDLANHFIDKPEFYNKLEKFDDEKVIEQLTQVRGIGVWSAQMFLMFSLGRPDVFAPDDLGLKNAMLTYFRFSKGHNRNILIKRAKKWEPYRSVASLYLWRSKDG